MLSPLKDPIYARLFAAQVIALLGTGLTTVALALLAFELAGDEAGQVLGIALAIKMIAYVTLSPVAGSFAHLVPRRAMLVGLDVARAGCVAVLPFVSEIWEIYALIFVMQACSAGFTPTFQATIPDVLTDEEEYTKALSLSRLAYDLEHLLSPSLAAAALLVVSFHALFAANAVAFLISAALVLSVLLPAPKPATEVGGAMAKLTFGLRAYLATPRLRGLLAFAMAAAAASAMVIINTVVYVQDTLGLTGRDTAILLAAFGGGSMAAALSLPTLLQKRSDRSIMMAAAGLMVAGLGAGMLLPAYGWTMALWFMLGAGYSAILLPSGRLLRRSSGEGDRPAYFAAHFALSHVCWLVTYPLAGWLGSAFGLAAAFGALGALALGATLVALFLWPAHDPDELEHVHDALEHEHLHVHDAHHQHDHEGWEGPEPHSHPHRHKAVRHRHAFVIDSHHPHWPV
ncbi:MAG: MFS transporter [Hyphomicrobiaceae bacterium]|nr:MFS transporter [Hyphomicrobiaceae bacterium]